MGHGAWGTCTERSRWRASRREVWGMGHRRMEIGGE